MKQVWIPKYGTASVLEVREAPDPTPQAGEIRIRVEACGVNFADVVARIGLYADAPKPPMVVGYEVAGTVDAVGEGVETAWLHAPVVAMTQFGGYSSAICVPARQVFRRPDMLSANDAAALPVNAITAYQMLVVMGSVRAGDKVLIHGAAGGVGWLAVQIAKNLGATVYGTASKSKHARLSQLGVDVCIDYTQEDFVKVIRQHTHGKGVEVVLDPIGGGHWRRSYNALAPTGRLLMFGQAGMVSGEKRNVFTVAKWAVTAPWLAFHFVRLINDNKGVMGVNLGRMWHEVDRMRPWFDEIIHWYSAGKLEIAIDAVYPFEQAAAAHERLQNRQNVGKVLLRP